MFSLSTGLEIPMESVMSNHNSESASYHSTTIFTIEDETVKKNVRYCASVLIFFSTN